MRLFRAALLAAAMTLTLPAASFAATPADVLGVAANIDDIVRTARVAAQGKGTHVAAR